MHANESHIESVLEIKIKNKKKISKTKENKYLKLNNEKCVVREYIQAYRKYA